MPQTMVTGGFLYLTAKLSPGGSSFIGDRDLGITKGRLKMRDPNNPDSTYTEWIEFGSVVAVGDGTFTYGSLVRQLSQTSDPATSLGTGNTWVAGSEAKLVAMHDQLADRLNGVLVPVYATTVARDAAITAPVNGMSCYVTADGVFYDYQGGAWATRGNSATANASTTVAGKVEQATSAEVLARTVTGGTGAPLFVNPGDIGSITPVGMVVAFGAAAAPSGWVLCDGSAISRTTYAALFAVISTTYGVGDGVNTFNVPSMKGKVIVGYNSAETEFDALGETGGAKTHVLTATEMPSHTHAVTGAGNSYGAYGGFTTATNTTGAINTTSAGSDGAHNNLQPYITLNYIIKV